ncbi:MAG: hypothetical protein ACXABL_11110 [Candidatus Thorarchaeota archaeon]|jgi:DNA-binding transcriptional ArsR family regulator
MTKEIPDSLEGIVLTDEGKKPPSEVVFITDDETAAALDDPVRFDIIKILRQGINDTRTTKQKDDETGDTIIRQRDVKRYALSVVEIVKMSDPEKCDEECGLITKNQVYHHLPKLIEAGYVIKYGTVTTGKRTTDYYRRTSKGFVITTREFGKDAKVIKEKTTDYTDRMLRVFDLSITEEQRKELIDLQIQSYNIQSKARPEIAALIKGDVAEKKVLDMYEFLLQMHSLGSKEYMKLQHRIHDILFPKKKLEKQLQVTN